MRARGGGPCARLSLQSLLNNPRGGLPHHFSLRPSSCEPNIHTPTYTHTNSTIVTAAQTRSRNVLQKCPQQQAVPHSKQRHTASSATQQTVPHSKQCHTASTTHHVGLHKVIGGECGHERQLASEHGARDDPGQPLRVLAGRGGTGASDAQQLQHGLYTDMSQETYTNDAQD